MFQSNKQQGLSTILAPGSTLWGNMQVEGDILLHGKIKGNLAVNGVLRTSEHSTIVGDVEAESAFISGKIDGDLKVRNKAVLGKNSELKGCLQAKTIAIEEGANFEGNCEMPVNAKAGEAKYSKNEVPEDTSSEDSKVFSNTLEND